MSEPTTPTEWVRKYGRPKYALIDRGRDETWPFRRVTVYRLASNSRDRYWAIKTQRFLTSGGVRRYAKRIDAPIVKSVPTVRR